MSTHRLTRLHHVPADKTGAPWQFSLASWSAPAYSRQFEKDVKRLHVKNLDKLKIAVRGETRSTQSTVTTSLSELRWSARHIESDWLLINHSDLFRDERVSEPYGAPSCGTRVPYSQSDTRSPALVERQGAGRTASVPAHSPRTITAKASRE